MRKTTAFCTLLIACGFTFHPPANGQSVVTQWDRNSALAAIRTVKIDAAVHEISNISSLADGTATLNRLKQIETRNDWPLPAREAVLYQFTRSLAELPRDAVAKEVMQHLLSYQARTLVPHEDHAEAYINLFNIRGTAAGVENGWQRTEFAVDATTLLETNPETLVSNYMVSANKNLHSGYLDALQSADLSSVVSVQNATLKQFDKTPRLTPLLGATAAITADNFAIQQLLTKGQGAGLSSALVELDKQLQTSEIAALMAFSIHQAPANNAALAIAAWWPRLRHDPLIRELMVELLADPALGASAALALARNPDIQTIKMLQETASGNSTAARRAQMALDFNRNHLVGESQP